LDYAKAPTLTDRLDRILLHKVFGLAIFALIMAGLFVSIFWLADPIMGGVESGIAWLGGLVEGFLPNGPIKDLWTDGIVAGVGGVLVFIPQIALLFLFLAIMEDSGYLARAAFLMDRVLSKVGLHGKSFIPLLSSFACAIPGIMAARTIECRRDRLATIFVAPFMSCSARLPVYALLIGAFFASYGPMVRGGILLSLYALGILAAVGTAMLFKLGSRREPASSFILELPMYKRPQLSQVARVVGHNTWAFISKAGTIIFCLSVILWAMMYYPRLPEAQRQVTSADARQELTARWDREHEFLRPLNLAPERLAAMREDSDIDGQVERSVAAAQLRHSLAGRLGHAIEPVIRPLGYDWKMGVGLISAFAAREVFVSTMGIVYAAGDAEADDTPLREAMMSDRKPDGSLVWTPLVATSLLVWFVLAMQCMSTLAIVRRETGTWTWPLLQMLYMTGLAYVFSLAVYQVGRIWFA
jgi:ferrous iron transport protein B